MPPHRSTLALLAAIVLLAGCTQSEPEPIRLSMAERLDPKPGLHIHKAESSTYNNGKFAVYVPKQYDGKTPLPVVVSAHGVDGNGEQEIAGWIPYADKYGWIVVCPSYLSAAKNGKMTEMSKYLREDAMMLNEIMRRVFGSFPVERRLVMHTGFSGGGAPTWYVAMSMPDIFNTLCFRSANFYGSGAFLSSNLAAWRERPIYLFWGENDHPIIVTKGNAGDNGDGPAGLEYVERRLRCHKLKHEVLPGGKHEPRIDLAAKWFAEEVTPAALADKAE